MKNNLERFIRDNREAFDASEPPVNLWARIESGLGEPDPATEGAPPAPGGADGLTPAFSRSASNESPRQRLNGHSFGRSLGARWWVAASVTLFLLAGGLFLNYRYGFTEQPEVVAVDPTYAKAFVQYARLVDQKQAELKAMTTSNPALYEAFATDLDRLERSYQTLKADLPTNPNQETLVQAMIHNLQLQLDLLNEQLRVIQRMKAQNNNTNEHLI